MTQEQILEQALDYINYNLDDDNKLKLIIYILEDLNRKFYLYALTNNKNELLNNVQFRKLDDCKRFINEILKGSEA